MYLQTSYSYHLYFNMNENCRVHQSPHEAPMGDKSTAYSQDKQTHRAKMECFHSPVFLKAIQPMTLN